MQNKNAKEKSLQKPDWKRLEENVPLLALKEYFEETSPSEDEIRRSQQQHRNLRRSLLYA